MAQSPGPRHREGKAGAEKQEGKLRTPRSRGRRLVLGPCPSTRLLWGREMDSVSLAQSYRTTLPIHT